MAVLFFFVRRLRLWLSYFGWLGLQTMGVLFFSLVFPAICCRLWLSYFGFVGLLPSRQTMAVLFLVLFLLLDNPLFLLSFSLLGFGLFDRGLPAGEPLAAERFCPFRARLTALSAGKDQHRSDAAGIPGQHVS